MFFSHSSFFTDSLLSRIPPMSQRSQGDAVMGQRVLNNGPTLCFSTHSSNQKPKSCVGEGSCSVLVFKHRTLELLGTFN